MTPEEKAEKYVDKCCWSFVETVQSTGVYNLSSEDINKEFKKAYLAGYAEAKLEEADLVGKLMARDIEIEDLKEELNAAIFDYRLLMNTKAT